MNQFNLGLECLRHEIGDVLKKQQARAVSHNKIEFDSSKIQELLEVKINELKELYENEIKNCYCEFASIICKFVDSYLNGFGLALHQSNLDGIDFSFVSNSFREMKDGFENTIRPYIPSVPSFGDEILSLESQESSLCEAIKLLKSSPVMKSVVQSEEIKESTIPETPEVTERKEERPNATNVSSEEEQPSILSSISRLFKASSSSSKKVFKAHLGDSSDGMRWDKNKGRYVFDGDDEESSEDIPNAPPCKEEMLAKRENKKNDPQEEKDDPMNMLMKPRERKDRNPRKHRGSSKVVRKAPKAITIIRDFEHEANAQKSFEEKRQEILTNIYGVVQQIQDSVQNVCVQPVQTVGGEIKILEKTEEYIKAVFLALEAELSRISFELPREQDEEFKSAQIKACCSTQTTSCEDNRVVIESKPFNFDLSSIKEATELKVAVLENSIDLLKKELENKDRKLSAYKHGLEEQINQFVDRIEKLSSIISKLNQKETAYILDRELLIKQRDALKSAIFEMTSKLHDMSESNNNLARGIHYLEDKNKDLVHRIEVLSNDNSNLASVLPSFVDRLERYQNAISKMANIKENLSSKLQETVSSIEEENRSAVELIVRFIEQELQEDNSFDIDELQAEVDEAIKNRESVIKELGDDLLRFNAVIEEKEGKAQNLIAICSSLIQDVKQREARIKSQQSSLEIAKANEDRLTNHVKAMRTQIAHLLSHIKAQESECNNREGIIESLKEGLNSKTASIESLSSTISSKTQKIETLTSSIENWKEYGSNMAILLEETERDLSKLRFENEELLLASELLENENKSLNEELTDLRNQTEFFTRESETKIYQKDQIIAQLEEEIQTIDEQKRLVSDDSAIKTKQLEIELASERDQNKVHSQKIKEDLAVIKNLENQLFEQNKKIESAERIEMDYSTQEAELKAKLNAQEAEITAIKQEMDILISENEGFKESIMNLTSHNDNLAEKVESLEQVAETSQRRVNDSDNEAHSISQQLEQRYQEIEDLKAENNNLKVSLETRASECENLIQNIADLNEKLLSKEKECEDIIEHLNQSQSKDDSSAKLSKEKEDEILKLKQVNYQMTIQNGSLKRQIDDLKTSITTAYNKESDLADQLKAANSRIFELENLSSEFATMSSSLSKLTVERNSLLEQLEMMKQQGSGDNEEDSLKLQLCDLHNDIRQRGETIDQLNETVSSLQEQIETYQQTVESLSGRLEESRKFEDKAKRVDELIMLNGELKKKIELLSMDLADAQDDIAHSERIVRALSSKTIETNKAVSKKKKEAGGFLSGVAGLFLTEADWEED